MPATRGVLRRSILDGAVLLLVVAGSLAIGVFVHHTTDSVREGLPASLLEQQNDVAATLHELATLSRLLEGLVLRGEHSVDMTPVLDQVEVVEQRLVRLRAEHEFDVLTGVSDLHAAVAPAMQDVDRWLREGVSDFPLDSLTVLSLAASRVEATYERVRGVMDDVNTEAVAILGTESSELARFGRSLQLYLAAFGVVTLGIVALMIRYRMAERRAARERERLRDSIESIDAGFALYDREDRLLLCNSRYRALNPIAEERMVPGVTFARLARGSEEERQVAGNGPFELRLPGGRVIRVSEHRTSEGGTVGIYSEITDLRQAQDRLEHLANHDPLTGLANRNHLRRVLDRAVARCSDEGGTFALMLLDLDRFKQVNDSFGHASGDRLLCRVGEVVRGCLRGDDTVARVGGDEFALLVERPRSRDELAALARRVLAGLSERIELDGNDVSVTGSIGIAVHPHDGKDLATLEHAADLAGYEAKRAGRDGFCFFESGLSRREDDRRQLVSRLRDALAASDGMALGFWPARTVDDDRLAALHATPSWRDPALAALPAGELFELAENSGQGRELAQRLLELAADTLQVWQTQGIAHVPVTVPVSASLLHSPRFAHELGSRVREEAGARPLLTLGLREGAAAAQPVLAAEAARRLRRGGVPVVLLDVGAAGAPLALTETLAPAAIELSRSLTARLGDGESSNALIESVVLLGRSLDAPVTAVGPADGALIEQARTAGCARYRPDTAETVMDLEQTAAALRALAAATPLTLAAQQPGSKR